MKINKNLIKELSDYLKEFNLSELEYGDKDTRIKVSRRTGLSLSDGEVSDKVVDKNAITSQSGKKIT